VSKDQAAAAGRWNDSLAKLHTAWEGLKLRIAQPVMDVLTPMLEGWLDWFKQNPAKIEGIVRSVASGIVAAVTTVADVIAVVAENLKAVALIAATAQGARMGSAFGPWGTAIGAGVGFVGGAYAANRIDQALEAGRGRMQEVRNTWNINLQQSDRSLKEVSGEFEKKVGDALSKQRSKMSADLVKRRL
jgi:hypothetical protein